MSSLRERAEQLSPTKRALVALEKMQGKLERLDAARTEAIAIVGAGLRFPGGATNLEAYWSLLRDGRHVVREVPPDRWNANDYYDPDPQAPGKMNTKLGGFLDDIAHFDPAFFGVSPREAVSIDPQQRLLMEVGYEALEDAGLVRRRYEEGRMGVFVGIMSDDYASRMMRPGDYRAIDPYYFTGNGHSFACGRLSYVLGVRGPSMAINTACSSSLVAVHEAVRALRANEINVALAGGVSLMITPELSIFLTKAGVLAADGTCKTFDDRANGIGRGEGAALIVLKRLSDAQAAGDRILALIRGSAVNHDGQSGGLTVPSGTAQQLLIRTALADAGLVPARVSYLEAHGTGTSLGDPIEVRAAGTVFREGRTKDEPLMIGSVKTNFGHLDSAAGIAGLLKVVAALRHAELPPHLHLQRLNQHIPWEDFPLNVPTSRTPWVGHGGTRIAGVNSFGLSGVNAHVVLEEAPALPPKVSRVPELRLASPRAWVLAASGKDSGARLANASNLEVALQDEELTLADAAHVSTARRDHHGHRVAVVATSKIEAQEKLAAFRQSENARGVLVGGPGAAGKLAFVFPGQGSQWFGMSRQLHASEPVFRQVLEDCDRAFRRYVDWSLLEELASADESSARYLKTTDFIQPSLFAVGVATAALLRAWGVEPDGLIGHSMGEVGAAFISGALGLDDAARVICERSRLAQTAWGGVMAVLELGYEDAQKAMRGREAQMSVAAVNNPRSVVISGDRDAVTEFIASQEQRGVFGRLVKVDFASHSPHMDRLLPELSASLAGLKPRAGEIPIYSTVNDAVLDGASMNADYWCSNLRNPVLFFRAMERAIADGFTHFVECSAHPLLVRDIEGVLKHRQTEGLAVGSLRRNEPERVALAETVAQLHVSGFELPWDKLQEGRMTSLPSYAWQRERYWYENRSDVQSAAGHPLLGQSLELSRGGRVYQQWLSLADQPWLRDHRVQGLAVLPGAAYVEMALAAAEQVAPGRPVELHAATFSEMLVLPEEGGRTLQLELTLEADAARFEISSKVEGERWRLHAHGRLVWPQVGPVPVATEKEVPSDFEVVSVIDQAAHLAAFGREQTQYGPAFQGLQRLSVGRVQSSGEVVLPGFLVHQAQSLRIHPALLDACFQALRSVVRAGEAGEVETYLPVRIEKLLLQGPVPTQLRLQVALQRRDGDGFSGDLRGYDPQGALVLEVRGFVARRLALPKQAQHADWFFEVGWVEKPRPPVDGPLTADGAWLILSDFQGVGAALEARLRELGQACLRVPVPDTWGRNSWSTNDWSAEQRAYAELFSQRFGKDLPPCRGIIHLAGLDADLGPTPGLAELKAAESRTTLSLLAVSQAVLGAALRRPPRLFVVTRGAQAVGSRVDRVVLAAAPVWGLARTLANEASELEPTRIDLGLESWPGELDQLVWELTVGDGEGQRALRQEGRFVARLRRPSAYQAPSSRVGSRAVRLVAQGDRLGLVLQPPRAPGPGEVEIRMEAAVLEPGALVDGATEIGAELSGVVTRVGADVGLVPGQAVMALVAGAVASVVTVPAAQVAPKPQGLDWAQAARLPRSFAQVAWALQRAQLQAGERVAVLGLEDATEIVLALIRRAQGEPSSPEQAHVVVRLDRRPLPVLRPSVRIVDLGGAPPSSLPANATYYAADLLDWAAAQPAGYAALLSSLGELSSVPSLGRWALTSAVGLLARARADLGPQAVVVTPDGLDSALAETSEFKAVRISNDKSYLITGGFGGLGQAVARWLVQQGARHLALVGRSGAPAGSEAFLAEIRSGGATVLVGRADLSSLADTERFLAEVRAQGVPIGGVIHAAGVLEDATVSKLSPASFAKVNAPKLDAAWNLHCATLSEPIELFCLFGSLSGILEMPGQGNYAAANNFVDALAHHRRALGLPAQTIDWGVWAQTGLAAQDGQRGARLATRGLGGMATQDALSALGQAWSQPQPQLVITPFDLRQWSEYQLSAAGNPFFEALAQGPQASESGRFAEELQRAPAEAQRGRLEQHLREQIANVLRLPLTKLDVTTPLGNLGLDSLMSLEIRNRLEASLGLQLSATLVWGHPTVRAMADFLGPQLGLGADLTTKKEAEPQPVSAEAQTEMEDTLNALAALLGVEATDG